MEFESFEHLYWCRAEYAARTDAMRWLVHSPRPGMWYYELLPRNSAEYFLARIETPELLPQETITTYTDVVHLRYAARIQAAA